MVFRFQATCSSLLISILLTPAIAFAEAGSDYRGVRPMSDFSNVTKIALRIERAGFADTLGGELARAVSPTTTPGPFQAQIVDKSGSARDAETWTWARVMQFLDGGLSSVSKLVATGRFGNVSAKAIAGDERFDALHERSHRHAIATYEQHTYRPTYEVGGPHTLLILCTSLEKGTPVVFPTAQHRGIALRTTARADLPPGIAELRVTHRSDITKTPYGSWEDYRTAHAIVPIYRARLRAH